MKMHKSFFPLLVVMLIAACHDKSKDPAAIKIEKTQQQWQLGEIVQREIGASIHLPGQLQPFEFVQVFPKINGFVKNVLVDRGSHVHKGQVMIQLEAPEIEQQYYAAKSKYLQVYSLYIAGRDNYERLVNTSKTPGTVSANDLELAKAKMEADSASAEGEKSSYKALAATRNYLTVIAPFDGVISERNVHPGALVGPNIKADDKPMLVLQQESVLRLVINVPEVYSNQFSDRSIVDFKVNSLPDHDFKGTISRAAGALDTKYRSEAIEVDVNNKEGLLKPGMYAEVEFKLSENDNKPLVVPHSAIVTSTEGKYVVVVRDGKTAKVDVQEGNSEGDSTEIFGNIHQGEQVVLHATDETKEGIAVNGKAGS